MSTKYLFFDLDGTISFDGDTVDPETLEYIERVRALGHKVFINTGRGPAHISKKIINALPWDGIIAGSAYMQHEGKTFYFEPLTKEQIKALYSFCKEKNVVGIFEGIHKIYTTVPYPVTDVLLNDENIDDDMEIPCITVLTPMTREEADKLFPDMELVLTPGYFEGTPKGHTKETCMKIFAEHMGITADDMIAFGDSLNDENMLKFAGTSVAISSAPDRFDEFVTMRCDSVIEAIKKIFNI